MYSGATSAKVLPGFMQNQEIRSRSHRIFLPRLTRKSILGRRRHEGFHKNTLDRISVWLNLTFNTMLGNIQTSTHVIYFRLLRLCMISLPLTVGRCHRRDVPMCELNIVMVKPHRHPSFVRLKVGNPWNPRLFLHHSYPSLCVSPFFITNHISSVKIRIVYICKHWWTHPCAPGY